MSERPADERKRRRRRRRRRRARGRPAPVAAAPGSAAPAPAAPAAPGSAASAPEAPAVPDPAASAPAAPADHATAERAAANPAAADSASDARASRRDRAARETSAGGIVYRLQDGEPLFLLIRDSYRNWGFPKGHLEAGEAPEAAAVREVEEETGLGALRVDGAIETIDWFFRFRGRLVHKVCHFYLMRTHHRRTLPQRAEGITACRWARYDEATRLISYANARAVLERAHAMVQAGRRAGGHDG